MELESILIAAALAAALAPVWGLVCRTRRQAAALSVLLFAVAWVCVPWVRQSYARPSAIDPSVIDRPIVDAHDEYVSSSKCRSCHPDQYASWKHSYHHTMTQEAVPRAVAGRFDGVVLTAGDWRYSLERRGDEFWTVVERPSEEGGAPERIERPVVLTTGSHHYQVYWLPDEKKGVLRAFPFVYLLDEAKWIPRKAAFLSPPEPNRTVEKARWNNGCAKCHSLDAKWRPIRPRTDTRVAELGISCEACHGPAEEHASTNRNVARRYLQHWEDGGDPTAVQPEDLDSRRASEVCGQCHGISQFPDFDDFTDWANHGYRYRPGDVLAKTRDIVRGNLADNTDEMQALLAKMPEFLGDSFWGDGAVRIAGREYNGLLETPCFQRGEMSCLSCHQMHRAADDPRSHAEWADDQLKPGMRGNAACVQCHADYEGEEALTHHTGHEATSTGSECQNCHMPYTTYGLLKAIRSHTIDSPSVYSSLETGRPNACNQCHLDKTLAWSAAHLQARYGTPLPPLTEDERTVAASVLWLLKGHAGQRALAAWTMGWEPARQISGGDWMAPYLSQLLVDPYDAVRFVAYRALRRQPGFADFQYDSLASRPELSGVAAGAYARWRRIRAGENRSAGPEVLLREDGTLDRDTIARLSAQRDDRPVVFRE